MISSAAICSESSMLAALRRAIQDAVNGLNGTAQCGIVFIGGAQSGEYAEEVLELWHDLMPGTVLFGGVSDSIIGTDREIEDRAAASVLLLGGMSQPPNVLSMECLKTPDGPSVMGLDEEVSIKALGCSGLLTIACPMTFSVDMLFASLEMFQPDESSVVPVIGGYASCSPWGTETIMFGGDRIYRSGAIGLVVPPELRWTTVVSQGCRPIGESMIVTAIDGQMLKGLGGKPALDQLRSMFSQLPNTEREKAIETLLIGRAISEYSETFAHGDFLIRNVAGVDPDERGVIVTDRFKVGQTVRFHILDSEAADADLSQLLSRASHSIPTPTAGLLFSCNGRGSRMFGSSGHDAKSIANYFPKLPLSGFFAAGEFGPIGSRNLVHGFTAVAAFLHER